MTICNMSIEMGARGGMIAPDSTTFEYLRGREFAPKGEEWEKIHAIYDKMPAWLYDHNNLSYEQIAEQIDTLSKKEIKAITAGELLDWAHDAATESVKIYDINPMFEYELDDDTVEKSREIIATQLRNAGYRLAAKLNEYFNY